MLMAVYLISNSAWSVQCRLVFFVIVFDVKNRDWIIDPRLELVGPHHVVHPITDTESDENEWEQNAGLLLDFLRQMLVV